MKKRPRGGFARGGPLGPETGAGPGTGPCLGARLLVFGLRGERGDHEVREIDAHDAWLLGHGVTPASVGIGVGVASGAVPVVGAEAAPASVGTGWTRRKGNVGALAFVMS